MEKIVKIRRLRAHHLMCLSFYEGKGYSSGFAVHMGKIKNLLEKGATVELVCETDIICAQCPNNKQGICESAAQVQGYDQKVMERCGFSQGETLEYQEFHRRVKEHILDTNNRSKICGDCQWNEICNRSS